MEVDCLYQSTLDRTFYNNMVEWFGLSDCYDLANQVHGLWFDAHQRAEQEFVEYTDNIYKSHGQQYGYPHLTSLVFLNDDYEGGLIEFPEHDLSIKPPAGSAIVFNSNELHLVTDLKDKHRYMWSCFVYNK